MGRAPRNPSSLPNAIDGFRGALPILQDYHDRSAAGLTDYEPFRAWRVDPSQWLPIARDIARSHGLACTAPHVFAPEPTSSSPSTKSSS